MLDSKEKRVYLHNDGEIIRIISARSKQLGKRLQILGKWMHKEEDASSRTTVIVPQLYFWIIPPNPRVLRIT
jgi:hypothetical protein